MPASFSIDFYYDSNSDDNPDRLLNSESNLTLNPMDSISVMSDSPIENVQSRMLTAARVNYQDDEDTLNNYLEKIIEPGIEQNALLINEVMYSPSINEPEWIEFVNVSNDTLNLKNWMVGDILPEPSKHLISNEDFNIVPENI